MSCDVCKKTVYAKAKDTDYCHICADCWVCPDCGSYMERVGELWVCDECGHCRTELGILKKLRKKATC